ncbi:hypothetical protein [Nostoc sp.]
MLRLTQELSETFISPCRASCFKSGNRKGALASLRPLRFDSGRRPTEGTV